jgi:hypothetical protein
MKKLLILIPFFFVLTVCSAQIQLERNQANDYGAKNNTRVGVENNIVANATEIIYDDTGKIINFVKLRPEKEEYSAFILCAAISFIFMLLSNILIWLYRLLGKKKFICFAIVTFVAASCFIFVFSIIFSVHFFLPVIAAILCILSFFIIFSFSSNIIIAMDKNKFKSYNIFLFVYYILVIVGLIWLFI